MPGQEGFDQAHPLRQILGACNGEQVDPFLHAPFLRPRKIQARAPGGRTVPFQVCSNPLAFPRQELDAFRSGQDGPGAGKVPGFHAQGILPRRQVSGG